MHQELRKIRRRTTFGMFFLSTMAIVAACGTDGGTTHSPEKTTMPLVSTAMQYPKSMPSEARSTYIAAVQQSAPAEYAAVRSNGLAQLPNAAMRFVSTVDKQGLRVKPMEAGWQFSIHASAVGCEGAMEQLHEAEPQTEGNRAELHRNGVTEWYLNGALGVEQGFELHAAPSCAGPKVITVQVDGDLSARLDDIDGNGRGDAVQFVDEQANPSHAAIAVLERYQLARGGDFLLITQNIDTLHEQAGSKRMIKVHGTSDRYRCSRRDCEFGAPKGSLAADRVDLTAFRADPVDANVPRCPACNSFLRVHVLWFDETYVGHNDYHWREVCASVETQAKLVIVAGTSFSVGVTELMLQFCGMRNVPIFNIDPSPRVDDSHVTNIASTSETTLVEVCKELGIPLES